MKKINHYAVIGGQYDNYHYGDTPTLIGAKRLANRHQEYWDNWQGWHTPAIYRIEDTELIPWEPGKWGVCRDTERIPKDHAIPVGAVLD